MATTAPERREATWEEYLAYGEASESRVEYIDGYIVTPPSPTYAHQQAARRVANLLEAALPEWYVAVEGWAWRSDLPGHDEFVPDVMVIRSEDITDQARFTDTPALAVEILSSNRSADLVVKATKYARAGLPRYWVLDPEGPALHAFALSGVTYALEQSVEGDAPATLGIAPRVEVTLRLADLLEAREVS